MPTPRTETEWITLGRQAILEILDDQGAATIREIEARAAQRAWGLYPTIQPHILTLARRELVADDEIWSTTEAAPGLTGVVETFHPRTLPATYARRAARRKRALTARHHGWAESRVRWPRGLAGPAGEEALATVLAETDGFSSIAGESLVVLGVDLPGPIDNLAYFTTTGAAGGPWSCVAMFEVKNHRQWIYPTDVELLFFLAKAALVQVEHPTQLILPVFVCRIRHSWTLDLGRDLGFFAVQFFNQWLKPVSGVTQGSVDEVVGGLGYDDLRLGRYPNNALRKGLGHSLRNWAEDVADRWQMSAPIVDRHLHGLGRKDLADDQRRHALVDKIREDLEA